MREICQGVSARGYFSFYVELFQLMLEKNERTRD